MVLGAACVVGADGLGGCSTVLGIGDWTDLTDDGSADSSPPDAGSQGDVGAPGDVSPQGAARREAGRDSTAANALGDDSGADGSVADAGHDGADATAPSIGDATSDGASTSKADGSDSAVATADSGVDASPVCDGGPTVLACGSSCVDVATSAQNCRVCGHDCGSGSSCVAGVCQPALLYAGAVSGFAVDDAGIYFAPSAGNIVSCPLTGCILTPTVVATGTAPFYLAGGDLAFFESDGPKNTNLEVCPASACTSENELAVAGSNPAVSLGAIVASPGVFYYSQWDPGALVLESCTPGGDGGCATSSVISLGAGTTGLGAPPTPPVTAIAGSDSFVYFTNSQADAGMLIYSCPANVSGCTPTSMNADLGSSGAFAYGSDLYITGLQYNGPAGATPIVYRCPSTGCPTGSASALVSTQSAINGLAVDSSGIYWINGSTVEMCPLTGCGVAPVPVAMNQNTPMWIRFSHGFVYWVTTGDNSIWRVPEP